METNMDNVGLNWGGQYLLINDDCLETMDRLIEQGVKVDAIICDPPYGTVNCSWDNVIPFDKMWERLNALVKDNGAIVLFGTQPFTSSLVMSNVKGFKHTWVWHKKIGANMLNAKRQPLKTTEDIIVFSKKGKPVKYYPIMSEGHKDRTNEKARPQKNDLFGKLNQGFVSTSNNKRGDQRYPKHLIEFSNANQKGKVHPTQKPVPLMEYLIKTYTLEGETVLDFTMGSGSTGVACMNTNRRFIGIELDKTYFDIAKERIDKASKGE